MNLAVNNDRPIGTSERFKLIESMLQKAERCDEFAYLSKCRANNATDPEKVIYHNISAAGFASMKLVYLDCTHMLGGRDVDSQT